MGGEYKAEQEQARKRKLEEAAAAVTAPAHAGDGEGGVLEVGKDGDFDLGGGDSAEPVRYEPRN